LTALLLDAKQTGNSIFEQETAAAFEANAIWLVATFDLHFHDSGQGHPKEEREHEQPPGSEHLIEPWPFSCGR